jgi:hypothetical protein
MQDTKPVPQLLQPKVNVAHKIQRIKCWYAAYSSVPWKPFSLLYSKCNYPAIILAVQYNHNVLATLESAILKTFFKTLR